MEAIQIVIAGYINRQNWHILLHTMELFHLQKQSNFLTYDTTWVNLEDTVLIQAQKAKHPRIPKEVN